MNILVLNCGSSSVKYQVIDPDAPQALLAGNIERVGVERSHADAIAQVLDAAAAFPIAAIGHRVVHGGERFRDAVLIDDAVTSAIEEWSASAPLHNPHNLAGIRAARLALPQVPQVAVFDTAFHASLPRRARTYAIDPALAARHRLRRFGFHGTSHSYVARLAAESLGRPLSELRLVSLHLGNGASACAIEFGHSTETSMGMTPLEGLVMGTRGGDLDAGVVLALQREAGMSLDEVDRLLNHDSGLEALSGHSHDLRQIEARAAEGDDRSRLAIAVFAHRVRKYIGAYAATMGGLDALILTGGIGENSASMRQRICQRFDFLGLVVDEDANADARPSHAAPVADISRPHARVRTLVVKTNEERMIAQQAARLVSGLTQPRQAGAIPIAVSARHVHLDAATFAALFGEDASPTHFRDLSQPGQYACQEKVALIGPRGRIDGVRLLGPLRSKNQVEVARTDEFALGVDAPVRDSGRTQASAPITLEGPNGSVTLPEGLICAKRHIHMTPDDARRLGVENGEEVEVAITGGPRDLVFGDVLIRVSPAYALEMHIDTDEANAAELSQGVTGDLVYTGISTAAAQLRSRKSTPSGGARPPAPPGAG